MLVAHINFIVWQFRMIIFNKGYGSTVATLKFCNGEHAELCTEQHAFEPRCMAEAILLRSWAKKNLKVTLSTQEIRPERHVNEIHLPHKYRHHKVS